MPPSISKEDLDKQPKVIVNQSVILNCPVDGKPPPVITWYKNGIPLDGTVQVLYISAGQFKSCN